jgi:hypothetical protein
MIDEAKLDEWEAMTDPRTAGEGGFQGMAHALIAEVRRLRAEPPNGPAE